MSRDLHAMNSPIERGLVLVALVVTVPTACAKDEAPAVEEGGVTATPLPAAPRVEALNAFYYYDDVEAAWRFYRDVLGFETAADYGFAKIMHVAPGSFLTLVDAAEGMHSSSEPKSVTLAIVTDDVQGWYDHLREREVPMRSVLTVRPESAHDGFVAIDPEGYLLEFERFNAHVENVDLTPRLAATEPLFSDARPPSLGVRATVLWLYYDDLESSQRFWEDLFDVDLLVDQGWAKVYPISSTGYVGLVDGSRGLHSATDDKAVTLSFLTEDVRGWLSRARALGVELRTGEIGNESDLVERLVGYDPTGYFLEWDNFLDRPGNERIVDAIR
jgi:catechol 2,3-dioxygenase-like lactoylglutathione lyase family enzyme